MYHKITVKLKKELDKDRFEHTLGVAYTAANLAMSMGYDIRKAYLAGLLHDCAKCIDNDRKFRLCKENGIILSDIEYENPFLIHAKLGAFIAQSEYGCEDEDILAAIRSHTTGQPGMSVLEEIVFVADYIEPGRDKQPRLEVIRKACYQNIKLGILMILEDTLNYLNSRKAAIDPTTQETYDYYKSIV